MTAMLTSPKTPPTITSSVLPEYPPVGRSILAGVILTLVGFGGLNTWAALAPLASAAVAPGIVTADTNRKTVQHLDGGVVAEIAARDGDRVEARQVLMRLDDLETRSVVALLEGQRRAYAAQEARLLAERDNMDKLVFPTDLADLRSDPDMAEILSGQERIFQSRRASLNGRTDVTHQRIAQYQAQIKAFESQFNAGSLQLALIREELVDVAELTAKGLERKPRLLALKRQAANLEGSQGEYLGNVAQAREAIAEAEMEILSVAADHQSEVATELREVQTQLAEVTEKLAAAQIRHGRRDVVAPEAGTVLNLRYFAPGAVVPPGGPILDLVPRDDSLVVEARVRPSDIDVVHAGLSAKIIFSAFKSRTTPQIDGKVTRVTADALKDERTGEFYYLARVSADQAELQKLKDIQLQAGMPAETLIITGERTMLQYLTQPIRDSFRTAFREQ
jgi:HlyD family type I secretion membrane fusion protein